MVNPIVSIPYEDFIFIVILSGIPSTEETMSSLLTVIQSSSQSHLGSQYSECPVSEWNSGGNSTNATSSNGQVGSVCFLRCCVVFDKREGCISQVYGCLLF